MILANYFVMMAYSMIHYIYWILFSKYGKAWLSYQLTLIFLEAIVLCIYLIIINVVANGYKIVHEQFNWNAFAKNIAIISILVVTSLLMQYTNFFLLIFLVVEIIALVVLLKMDISKTISMGRDIISNLDLTVARERHIADIMRYKIKYYRTFTLYLYIYWVMEVTVQFLRPFLALYHEWIFSLVHHILTLISMSFLFITLNYTIEIKIFERRNQEHFNIPLPFDQKKDPKIGGDIVIVESVWDSHSVYTVGIEEYGAGPTAIPKPTEDGIGGRADVYRTETTDLETYADALKIKDQQQLSHCIHSLQDNNLTNNIKLKSKDHSLIRGPKIMPGEESKNKEESEGSGEFQHTEDPQPIFQVSKVFDFRNSEKISRLKAIDELCKITKANTAFDSDEKNQREIFNQFYSRKLIENRIDLNIKETKEDSYSSSIVDVEMIHLEFGPSNTY